MTVLPASATRSAPAGTVTFAPAATTRPSRTTMVALSMGARAVPSIRRTLVNALVDEGGWPAREELSTAPTAAHVRRERIVILYFLAGPTLFTAAGPHPQRECN